MIETNRSDDYATGIAELDLDEIEIPSEVITLDDGLVHFDYDIEWRYNHTEYVVTCYSGETPEGAPVPVHAVYDDREAMIAWTRSLLDDETVTTVADMQAVLETTRDEYNQNVMLGWGDWLRGHVISESQKRRAEREATQHG